MPIAAAQKAALEEVVDAIVATTAGRSKRLLSDMFMDLVDKESWPEYYKVIPQPRCLTGVQEKISKNKYRDVLDAYRDLALVFANALHYNEDGSQIVKDARTLQTVFETEWAKHTNLPPPPTPAPPPQAKPPPPPAAPAPVPVPVVREVLKALPEPPPGSSPSTMDVDVDIEGDQDEDEGGDVEEEVEVEGDGNADGDVQMDDMDSTNINESMTRDSESDEIVKQLERGLPRWEGLGDKGWTSDLEAEKYSEIVTAVKNYKDVVGNRVATVVDSLPEESTIKDLSYNYPLSLKIIEGKARMKSYKSGKEFDIDFARLFEKGRRWYDVGSEQYGSTLLLQRLYQALTSPSPPPGPPYTSQTNFAALRAGPGTTRPVHSSGSGDSGEGVAGVTTFRVTTRDRTFVDELDYKGWNVRVADWLHLSNPDDPSRPIVAQVFKCWINDEPSRKGQPGVTVCWYYRPEQTVHPAHRQFWEGEVFKTGHFADHPLEDIIEKITCQFTARHIRGRPRAPFWYPGWPLYVCDSRYNDRERVFVKIKNWNSCVPEEVRRNTGFMPIYPFERTVFPRRFGSPFLKNKTGTGKTRFPGGIGDSVERAEGEKIEGGGTGRKRVRKPGTRGSRDETGPSRGFTSGSGATADHSSSVYQQTALQSQSQSRRMEDRSIISAAGGAAALGNNVTQEKLPPETAKHFDRDPETNEVLWFSGPPIDVARTPTPKYSLDYLHYLAMEHKRESQNGAKPVENGEKPRQPTATKTFNALWEEFFGTGTSMSA